MNQYSTYLANEAEQLNLAKKIADKSQAGLVIFLQGDLGVGKTTFVRGFIQALGFQGIVKSPTYTLVEPYQLGQQQVYHFDLYRLADPDELEYAGGRDYFDGESICLLEWPEKAAGYLPEADILCDLSYESKAEETGRRVKLTANTKKGLTVLQGLSH